MDPVFIRMPGVVTALIKRKFSAVAWLYIHCPLHTSDTGVCVYICIYIYIYIYIYVSHDRARFSVFCSCSSKTGHSPWSRNWFSK